MTRLLKKAFKEASELLETEQNALARWLMDEVLAERKWQKAFFELDEVLEKLAAEALEDHAQGKATQLPIN